MNRLLECKRGYFLVPPVTGNQGFLIVAFRSRDKSIWKKNFLIARKTKCFMAK